MNVKTTQNGSNQFYSTAVRTVCYNLVRVGGDEDLAKKPKKLHFRVLLSDKASPLQKKTLRAIVSPLTKLKTKKLSFHLPVFTQLQGSHVR